MMNLKDDIEFKAWPKIIRSKGSQVTITEKMDGTNACIIIEGGEIVGIQSRKRLIQPAALSGVKDSDNQGFAAWVYDHAEELVGLEDGYHYGEWVGEGIQKNPHALEGKHFMLFNTLRWNPDNPNLPECCGVVPTLYQGEFSEEAVDEVMEDLLASYDGKDGKPEGVIVFHHSLKQPVKYTFEYSKGKWGAK
jgi:ATP-dependent RNA circularization protein (DNA/RNA ligase family)